MAEDEEKKQAATPPPATNEPKAEDATADDEDLVEAHVWRAQS